MCTPLRTVLPKAIKNILQYTLTCLQCTAGNNSIRNTVLKTMIFTFLMWNCPHTLNVSLKVNFASNNTPKYVYFTFFCSRVEKHAAFLAKRCHLCGKTLMTLKTVQNCEKRALGSELLNFICEDIELDSREIHPQKVCSACRRVAYQK